MTLHSFTRTHFSDPGGGDGRLSWPIWLTHSGQFTHSHRLVPVSESLPAKDQQSNILTTVLCRQHSLCEKVNQSM